MDATVYMFAGGDLLKRKGSVIIICDNKGKPFPFIPLKSPLSCCVPVYMCVMCVCIIHSVFCVPEIGSPNPSSG